MDSAINGAARALMAGDPLAALDRVALRDDAAALGLRGAAMAQLGEFASAKDLLRRAARSFDDRERLSKARCVLALAEVALALRDLLAPEMELEEALDVFEESGDRANIVHARLLLARRFLLLGQVSEAARELSGLFEGKLPWVHAAAAHLVESEIAMRRLDATRARDALNSARRAADSSGIAALRAEVDDAVRRIEAPAGRLVRNGELEALDLWQVQKLFASNALVVDACRRSVTFKRDSRNLRRRPVLFSLAAVLAEAWPGDVERNELIRRVFEAQRINESWRARLRVEAGRLRATIEGVATVEASRTGYRLVPVDAERVVCLRPPVDGDHPAIVALMADGAAWSTSALALALGVSPRTVQRALVRLTKEKRVHAYGRGRARRWVSVPASAFATALLLPRVGAGL